MWLQSPGGLPGSGHPLCVKGHEMHPVPFSVGGMLWVEHGLDISMSADKAICWYSLTVGSLDGTA